MIIVVVVAAAAIVVVAVVAAALLLFKGQRALGYSALIFDTLTAVSNISKCMH